MHPPFPPSQLLKHALTCIEKVHYKYNFQPSAERSSSNEKQDLVPYFTHTEQSFDLTLRLSSEAHLMQKLAQMLGTNLLTARARSARRNTLI